MLDELQEQAPLDIPEQIDFVEADKGKRFFNMIIDILGYFSLAYLLGAILGGYMLFDDKAMDTIAGINSSSKILMLLLGFAILFIYFFLFEYFFGLTPGKLITNTRVVSIDGKKLSISNAIIRTLCRFIPFDNFSFLGNEGWHDSISKTMVVKRYEKDSVLLPVIITVFLFLTGGGVFFQTKVVSQFRHDTENTVLKKYEYKGLGFQCSANWKFDTTEMQGGLAHQILFTKAGYSGNDNMVVVFLDIPLDTKTWMQQSLIALKSQAFYKEAIFTEIKESKVWNKEAIYVDFKGSLMGNEMFGTIYGFTEGTKSVMIIKQSDSRQKVDNEFHKIEESIKATETTQDSNETYEEDSLIGD